MSKKVINDATLEAIADAIRNKNGSSDTYTPLQMPQAIEDIPTGDDTEFIKALSTQDDTSDFTTEITLPDELESLRPYVFYYIQAKKIICPESITEIKKYAFAYSHMKEFPVFNGVITNIGSNTFNATIFHNTLSVDIPGSTTERIVLGDNAEGNVFRGCFGIISLKLGNSEYGLYCNKSYTCAYMSGNSSYQGLQSAEIYINETTSYAQSFFNGCTKLEQVAIKEDNHTTKKIVIASNFFKDCSACLLYDFTDVTQVPTLSNTNAFTGINANAKIVVPDDLYNDWIAASNWATYSSYIVKESVYNAS